VTEEHVASVGAQITTEAVENEVNAIRIYTAHPSFDVNLQMFNTISPEHGHAQVCLFVYLLLIRSDPASPHCGRDEGTS
jgi:hypothetical protein